MEVSEINDAKFGAMLDSLRVVDPEMVCPSGKKITRICSNPQCKVALNCGQFKCESCAPKNCFYSTGAQKITSVQLPSIKNVGTNQTHSPLSKLSSRELLLPLLLTHGTQCQITDM